MTTAPRQFAATGRPPARSRVWHSLYALGRAGLPEAFAVAGRSYRLDRTVKHDFYAAVGFYDAVAPDGGPADRAVLKVQRATSFGGVPLRWVGRWLCRREVRMYERLADVPAVPALLGRVGPTGFAHAYAPGRPLGDYRDGPPLPAAFFDDLSAAIDALHARRVAYVDLNKPENVIVGDDGRPHLIDFQIAWDGELRWGWWWGWTGFAGCRAADRYHLLKHKRRFRPDLLTDADRAALDRGFALLRLHRRLSRPYFWARRRLFAWLRRTGRVGAELSK